MDINQVRFGNYSIGNSQVGSQQNREEKEEKDVLSAGSKNSQVENFSAENVMNALGLMGAQNLAFVSKTADVDPADYLDAGRISDIEAMMTEFDNGVSQIADVLESEFPGMLAADEKMALAASIYAKE